MKSIVLIKPYFKENRRKIAIGLLSLIIVDVLQLFIPGRVAAFYSAHHQMDS
jgi:hypothetical protein